MEARFAEEEWIFEPQKWTKVDKLDGMSIAEVLTTQSDETGSLAP